MIPASADLLPLQEVVARALARVEERFERQLSSELPPVQQLVEHVERYHGKMIRPVLAVLAGLATDRAATEPADVHVRDGHIVVAAVCEMVHLATLVHDDVLDEADTRRKSDTVNKLYGNEAAVILGDLLFSAAYHLCAQLEDQATSLAIAEVGMTLCAGELLQLHHRENFSLDEATYYEIVRRKTASLIAVACRLGASHAGATPETAARFQAFGLDLGVAFQIQDDLLDLTGDQRVVGKSLGKDAEKGKLTLPMIHHLAQAGPAVRGETLRLLGEAGHPGQVASGPLLVAALSATESIEYARRTAQRFVDQAKAAIEPLHGSPAKRLLLQMADAVITRAY